MTKNQPIQGLNALILNWSILDLKNFLIIHNNIQIVV